MPRVLSLIMALLIVVSIFVAMPVTSKAAEPTKIEKSYDIAVVFDNSGSMYENKGWCRAKYAMEIFASMLNYNRDKLHIFPMWEVTYDGSQPTSGGSYDAIEIKNKDDINRISNLYTVRPSSTPFEPIDEANEYLKKSKANEKWLIILTDGAFNQDERGKSAQIDLQQRVSSLASDEIKVQYLGFGGATTLKANEANNFFAKKSTDTSLKDDLVEICNKIFQRSVLPSNRLSGQSLKLDMSMKSVIVFAQGANAQVNSLKDSSGKDVAITLNSGQRKYSTIKANKYPNAPVDTSLAGQVVTFADCPKGDYTLSFSGADSIQIFYEPDVDIDIEILNSDGVRVTNPEDFVAGEYKITSRIVDRITGEDVTNHELLGNAVDLKTYVKTSNDSEYKAFENGSKITFAEDDETSIYVEGQYLGKYKISSKDDKKWEWLTEGFEIEKQSVAFKINIDAEQKWFVLKEKDSWKPIKIVMTVEGQPLTDEQMQKTNLTVSISDNMKYRVEMIPGGSAYNVFIAQDENGNYIEPTTGKFKMTASATYVDEDGKEVKAKEDNISFEVQKYSQIFRILFWLAIILIIILIWLMFMLQKVLPKSVVKENATFQTMTAGEVDGTLVNVEYRRKAKSLTISGPNSVDFDEQCSATFDLRAVDNRFTPSKRRRMVVVGIDSPCDEMNIGVPFVKYDGKWMKRTDLRLAESGRPVPPIEQVLGNSPRFSLSRGGGIAELNCKVKTIK